MINFSKYAKDRNHAWHEAHIARHDEPITLREVFEDGFDAGYEYAMRELRQNPENNDEE